MRKIITNPIIYTSVLFLLIYGCGTFRKSVLFGKHSKNESPEFHSIFLDERGSFYPETEIPNSEIKKCYGQLKLYYEKNNCAELKKQPNCSTFEAFQKQLIDDLAKSINKKVLDGKFQSITFILVGYNNKYEDSESKLMELKDKITAYLITVNKKTFFVPIFWDGKINFFSHLDALSIFNNANANSYCAGLQLRLLVNKLQSNNIKLISHSLGANVLTELLFNQISKVVDDSKKGENSIYKRLNDAYQNPEYITTRKQVTVGLVAPAISGRTTFMDYTKRGYVFNRTDDNYKIYIGFNKNDPVLKKVFPFLSIRLSSTSLGCNYKNEIEGVFALYYKNQNNSFIDTLDFSKKDGKKHRKHNITSYMKMTEYSKLIELIYQ